MSQVRPFLPLTKLQNQLLFEYIRESGYSEGANKLYERLKRDIGDAEHPAVNSKGEVAYSYFANQLGHTKKLRLQKRRQNGLSHHLGTIYTTTRALLPLGKAYILSLRLIRRGPHTRSTEAKQRK